MKLITVKEYCKIEKISDTGARKRVASKLVKSCQLDGDTYILVECKEAKLKQTIKEKNAIIKQLKTEAQIIINRENEVKELKAKIEKLESKLEAVTDKKEELYERVINHMTQIAIPRSTEV